jgi:hypothetical protein
LTPLYGSHTGPGANCVAIGTHLSMATTAPDSQRIYWMLGEAAVTPPARLQEADEPNIARVHDYLHGGSHDSDPVSSRLDHSAEGRRSATSARSCECS